MNSSKPRERRPRPNTKRNWAGESSGNSAQFHLPNKKVKTHDSARPHATASQTKKTSLCQDPEAKAKGAKQLSGTVKKGPAAKTEPSGNEVVKDFLEMGGGWAYNEEAAVNKKSETKKEPSVKKQLST